MSKQPRLRFEEVDKPVSVSKLTHVVDTTVNIAAGAAHRKVSEAEQENVGVESAHKLEETAEAGGHIAANSIRSHKLNAHRTAARARHFGPNPQFASNPVSRWQQKRAVKKQYAAARRAGQMGRTSAAKTTANAAKAAKKAGTATKETVQFVVLHWRLLIVVIILAILLAILLCGVSSCSVLVGGILSSVSGSTYPCRDTDMLEAEAAYAGMETELQNYLDNYESTHNYDEYIYDLDEIGHDPYVLISILTAYHQGEWTLSEVQTTLEMLFERQYTLTETVTVETRYDDDEPYEYSICTVTLENFDLSHLPVYIMGEGQVSMYATYIAALGNRPDLFPVSEYPNASGRQDYLDYDVPPEALEDEVFAAILAEAEKYLGYPYVWGGSNPSTSFDCSGYVSWVINHSGWNVGRLGATALCGLCTPVSPANARPGDLVFFKGTYDTPGVSHCGIYVGNGMMIHCGAPISYTNLNSSYWQQHLFCYGRLPEP